MVQSSIVFGLVQYSIWSSLVPYKDPSPLSQYFNPIPWPLSQDTRFHQIIDVTQRAKDAKSIVMYSYHYLLQNFCAQRASPRLILSLGLYQHWFWGRKPPSPLQYHLTGQNIKKLIKDGLIIKKPQTVHSRARCRKNREARRMGRHTGKYSQNRNLFSLFSVESFYSVGLLILLISTIVIRIFILITHFNNFY